MASQVSGYIGKINPGNGTQYSLGSTAYGVCGTAAATAAKTVEMTGFKLITGATVFIKFTYANTAANPTLNVQTTGAKPIVLYGTTAASTVAETTGWQAGAILCLTYDGTSWVRDQGYNTNTDRYVNSASFADDSTNTAASPVKMTLTRAGSDTATVTANIPKVSSSSAGVVPKGAAVSTQSQTTKFLREDGTWAAPSYTTNTNTDTLVKQTAKTDNVNYKILMTNSASPTSGNAAEAAYDADITINPSTNAITAKAFRGSLQNIMSTYDAVTSDRGDLGSGASPRYLPYMWYAALNFDPVDGDIIVVKMPSGGNAAGVWLSTNGNVADNYHPIAINGANRLTTHFAANTILMLVYQSNMTVSTYALAGANSATNITGIWRVINYYDSNTNTLLRTYASNTDIDVPLIGQSSANSTTADWSTYTGTYKDWYGAIPNDDAKRAKINLSTGAITVPGGITANLTGNADTATKLASTGTTAQFWRGDNAWSNMLSGAHTKSLATFVATAGSTDAWNKAGNYNLALVSSNNMLAFTIGGTANDRNANIQVGHENDTAYGNITGNLYLNKLGGQVYINSNYAAKVTSATSGQVMVADGTTGGIKTTGYTIATSVPSGAVFTDTKNTAGSTDTSSKIFLIGATEQSANPQTYSDNEVFITSGVLTAKQYVNSSTADSSHSQDTGASMVIKGGLSVAKKVSAKEVRIDNNQTSKGVSLQYDSTLEVLNFVFS